MFPPVEKPALFLMRLAALGDMQIVRRQSFEGLLVGELIKMGSRIHPRQGQQTSPFGIN
ncbi:MAG: hypothetical protein ACTSV3_06475 [Candidatus Thorarchaeota archaeon]